MTGIKNGDPRLRDVIDQQTISAEYLYRNRCDKLTGTLPTPSDSLMKIQLPSELQYARARNVCDVNSTVTVECEIARRGKLRTDVPICILERHKRDIVTKTLFVSV
jgi:hypothetical protein